MGKSILIGIFVIIQFSLFAQNRFITEISTPFIDDLFEIDEGSDGCYYCCGAKWIPVEGDPIGWLLKLDPDGSIIKEKELSGTGYYSILVNLHYLDNNNLISLGITGIGDSLDQLLYMKFDSELDIEIVKSYDLAPGYFTLSNLTSVIKNDSTIIVAGSARHYDYHMDMFMYELSLIGDSITSHFYPIESPQFTWGFLKLNNDTGYKLFAEGNFPSLPFVGGYCITFDLNYEISKIDSVPKLVYGPMYPVWIDDSTYLVGGKQLVGFPSWRPIGILKMTENDSLLANNSFGMGIDTINSPSHFGSIGYNNNEKIYFGGTSNIKPFEFPYQDDPSWILLTKLDLDLNPIWERYYGGDVFYSLSHVKATSDGGCIMLITKYDHTIHNSEYDMVIMKVNENGLITSTHDQTSIFQQDVLVYPNPGSDYLYVQTRRNNLTINVYDLNGKMVSTSKLLDHVTQIYSGFLEHGTYYYEIIESGITIESGKWIKGR